MGSALERLAVKYGAHEAPSSHSALDALAAKYGTAAPSEPAPPAMPMPPVKPPARVAADATAVDVQPPVHVEDIPQRHDTIGAAPQAVAMRERTQKVLAKGDQINHAREELGDASLAAAAALVGGAAMKSTRTGYRTAMETPYAELESTAPQLMETLHKAGAARERAIHVGDRRTARVVAGLDDEQQAQFGRKLVLDNLDDLAGKRQKEADDVRAVIDAARQASTAQANAAHTAAHDRADALQAEARTAAQAEAQWSRTAPADVEIDPRVRGAIGREQEAVARTVQITLDRAQQQADRIRQQADLTHGAKLKGIERDAADRHAAEVQPLQEAADHFRAHGDVLRPNVPADVELQPWFQAALARHQAYVEPALTTAALESGVSPQSLRSPKSAYIRLLSTERADQADIQRAMRAVGTTDPAKVQPRGPIGRAILGERPEVARLSAPLTQGARQGPLPGNAAPPPGAPPAGTVGVTGSARMAGGTAADYVTDYRRNIYADASDKLVKAARNNVYREVMNVGRELQPGEMAAPGKDVLTFDDTRGLVTGDDGATRVEVDPSVARAVRQFHESLTGKAHSLVGEQWRRASGALTALQLTGMPVEATSHANTLASKVGAIPGEADVLGKVLSAIPLAGPKAAAIREMLGTDFTDPRTRALEDRLADIGALRIESQPVGGMIGASHRWLFGPEGVDTRARLALARKFLQADPTASDEALRSFVTSKVGNYIRANSGVLVNAMQDVGVSSFARFQSARIPSSVRETAGMSGLPNHGLAKAGDVAGTLWRGPLGYMVGAEALSHLLAGHGTGGNEPGHQLDVQLGAGGKGLYLVDGAPKRLTPEEAQALGDRARPLYLPGATLNPGVATGLRATGARDFLFSTRGQGSGRGADAVRDIANTALGTLSPTARFLIAATTGRAPWLQSDNTMLKQVPSRLDKDKQLGSQVEQALAQANPALNAFVGQGGENGGRSLAGALAKDGKPFGGTASAMARVGEFLMPRLLTPGIGGVQNDQSAMARDERELSDALTDAKHAIRRAVGPQQQRQVIDAAVADAKSDGRFDPEFVRRELTHYANQPEARREAQAARALHRSNARHSAKGSP